MKRIRLGSCVMTVLASAVLLASDPGAAVAAEGAFEMKAYVDFPGGRQVIAGNYAEAIEAASRNADKRGETGMIANTNLCVALTKTGQFARAEAACTKAVTLAERTRLLLPRLRYGYDLKQDIATALSNRGVLRAVNGNSLAAARDFREAASVGRTGLPRRNLVFLEATTSDRVAMNRKGQGRD